MNSNKDSSIRNKYLPNKKKIIYFRQIIQISVVENPVAATLTIVLLLRMNVIRVGARGNFSIAQDIDCLNSMSARKIWRHELKKEESLQRLWYAYKYVTECKLISFNIDLNLFPCMYNRSAYACTCVRLYGETRNARRNITVTRQGGNLGNNALSGHLPRR